MRKRRDGSVLGSPPSYGFGTQVYNSLNLGMLETGESPSPPEYISDGLDNIKQVLGTSVLHANGKGALISLVAEQQDRIQAKHMLVNRSV